MPASSVPLAEHPNEARDVPLAAGPPKHGTTPAKKSKAPADFAQFSWTNKISVFFRGSTL